MGNDESTFWVYGCLFSIDMETPSNKKNVQRRSLMSREIKIGLTHTVGKVVDGTSKRLWVVLEDGFQLL